jgi:exopolysaccharide biosynthesis polyprenyl glycosylphosphotransferase
LLRERSQHLHSAGVTFDLALSALLFLAVLYIVEGGAGYGHHVEIKSAASLLALALVGCLAWPLSLQSLGLYDSQRLIPLDRVLWRLLGAGSLVTLLLVATAFLTAPPVSPRFPVAFGLLQCLVLSAERMAVFGALRLARRYGRNTRNVLIVGSGPRAAHVERLVALHPEWGLHIVGFADESDQPVSPELAQRTIFKLVEMPAVLRDEVIDEVIVACPRSMLGTLQPVVAACGSAGVPFTLLSDVFGDYLPAPRVTRFGTLAALRFAPVHHSQTALAVKRAIDVVGAGLGLIAISPLIVAAGVAIWLTSPGPILFRQMRCGLYGRRFSMYKLRTMCQDAEERLEVLRHLNEMDGPVFKLQNDPRVTRVGRILRRYSLDELPQLWNVLKGDMSLVGPRPPVPHEVAQYEIFQRRRLSMRPGITCLWQVSGRNQVGFDAWMQLDIEYIDSWSLGKDVWILLKTIPAVVNGTGE